MAVNGRGFVRLPVDLRLIEGIEAPPDAISSVVTKPLPALAMVKPIVREPLEVALL